MTPEVLILSSIYDFSADLVTVHLERSGVPYIRLNREQLGEHRISLDPLQCSLYVDGPSGRCVIGPELKSVWYRQPIFLRNTPSKPLTVHEQLMKSQWMAFARALCVFDEARWMNSPTKTYLAENKPYQLLTAKRCGFKVPSTLVTNDAEFSKSTFSQRAMIKSLDTVLLKEENDYLFTYSTTFDMDGLTEQNLSLAPVIAQELLVNKSDIRVTIIGKKIFAVRILSEGHGVEGDWRVLPRDNIEYVDIELDPKIVESCFCLLQKLNLNFAAIDLVETADGVYFIEVNPTGEWGWLSCETRPIDAEISNWLSTRGEQRSGLV